MSVFPDPAARRTGSPRVAIVDSDRGFLTVLSRRLSDAGWDFRISSAPPPESELRAMGVAALLVDLELASPDPWGYLEGIAAALPTIAIFVCTTRSTAAQRVHGLRLGADDWITKPCHAEEVVARLQAIVRRSRTLMGDEPIIAAELTIVPREFQAQVGGRSLDLTRREYELLHALAAAEGRVLERAEIYRRVWGYTMAHGDRSVDVFVRKLRQKLERSSPGWSYIHTHHGIGYRFAAVALREVETDTDRTPSSADAVPVGAP